LLGRLRRGAVVPPPYCELLLGALWAASGCWWAAGRLDPALLPLLLGLGWLAVAAGTVDVLHARLPDALTLPALPAALLLAVPLGGAAVLRAVLGAGVLAGGYLAVRVLAPAALGAGDVKLAAGLGAALGALSLSAVLLGALLASLLTVGVALGWAVLRWAVQVRAGLSSTVWGRTVSVRAGPPGARSAGGGWASGVPHGPAMLAAGWLVLAAAGTGGPLVGA
ncbi:MAG: leader peptidase (prepilin peptidase) / N-methyltransferase, partial [Pseudonocardiales bacterium]|nr:leader peptidase (prepilin peptidase) / N-methyltransferase [Pseudonocardiales bacterium]